MRIRPIPLKPLVLALLAAPSRLFYGWWVALSACLIIAVTAGVSFWGFGVFVLPLEQEFGWLRGEIAGAFSIAWLVGGIIGPFVGRAVDRYGARALVLGGTAATGLCFVLLASTTTLWQFYLFHLILTFFRSWMFYIPLSAMITRWFVRRRSVALAIFTSGFNLGGVVFVPLITFAVNAVGWRWTYLLCGGALCLVILPLALWVLRNKPEDMNLTPDGNPQPPHPVPSAAALPPQTPVHAALTTHWTVREALRTRTFWVIAVGFTMTILTNVSFSVHAIPLFVSRGLTPEASAVVVSASTAVAGLLRLPFGYVIDRTVGIRRIMLLLIFAQGSALAILLSSVEPWALWGFVALWGFNGGGMPLMESALLFRSFGDRHYGALLGTLGLVETAGILVGPILAGMVFDATGSYSWAIALFLGVTVAAVGCFLFFRPPLDRSQLSAS